MPRVGMNPNREKPFSGKLPPAILAVCVVVHLPDTNEYHKQRPAIVEASLATARKHAGTDHVLTVWDNGCGTVGKKIIAAARPDVVITSENIGKLNAWKHLLRMYIDGIVSIADDDILYYPGWLAEQVRVLEAYDNRPDAWKVASVTGVVTKQNAQTQCAKTWEWANANAAVFDRKGDIPNLWDAQHGMSCGRDRKSAEKYQVSNHIADVAYNGVRARVCGGHTQFVCRAATIEPVIPFTDRLMMPTFMLFDSTLDSHGLLKLATWERTARHLGNVLNDDDKEEIEELLK